MFNPFKKRPTTPEGTIDEQAHAYALDVLSNIGVTEALADLHRFCIENQEDKAEVRGVVIGGFRTVGLGAALVARYMQKFGRPPEEIHDAYYHFINTSAFRHIASDFGLRILPDEPVYLGVIEKEHQSLLNRGYEIGNLHEARQFEQAFEVWRYVMKMETTQPQETSSEENLEERLRLLGQNIDAASKK